MKLEKIQQWLATENLDAVETAWLEAMEAGESGEEMAPALEAMVKADLPDQAEALASMLTEEKLEGLEPAEALATVKPLSLAVPSSDPLRKQAAELYKQLYGDHEHFDAIFEAAGLLGTQSTRRAFRTLDICLNIESGQHLANRFDNSILKLQELDPVMREYVLTDAGGREVRLEIKLLADEYEPVPAGDFRVLTTHRADELAALIKNDPVAVLIGICQTHGGSIDAAALKGMLVDDYMTAKEWSRWWTSARNAAKKCPNLAVESGKPIVITYHEAGLTLEDELAPAAEAAKGPLAKLAIIQQYLREAAMRKAQPQAAFTATLMDALADEARKFAHRRPAEALAAALAIDAAAAQGIARPQGEHPSAVEVLAQARHPARAVAEVGEASLWEPAVDALAAHERATSELEHLLKMGPAGMLDIVAAKLADRGDSEAVHNAVATALANPQQHIDLFLWLWKGPEPVPSNCPPAGELLGRMLNMLITIDREWDVDQAWKKDVQQRVRSALSGRDYARYREALSNTSEEMGGTVKRLIERCDGLAEAVRGDMLGILREQHFGLFAKARIEPWLDEGIIWSTEEAIHRREDELKELVDVKMLENSRAIGAAAALGDLSENSEWKFAIEEQRMLKARAAKMQDELNKARVIAADDVPTNSVGVGTKVILRRVGDGSEITVSFLGPWDIDMDRRVFSYLSAMAQELMGRKIGETVSLKFEGEPHDYVIEAVAPAVK
jgi:transcription elongation GreA/GreB family factor